MLFTLNFITFLTVKEDEVSLIQHLEDLQQPRSSSSRYYAKRLECDGAKHHSHILLRSANNSQSQVLSSADYSFNLI